MNQRLDLAKVEAALKRAAHKALHGTREERSGRFLLEKTRQPVRNARHDAPKKGARRKD